jgi:hypothetical protein
MSARTHARDASTSEGDEIAALVAEGTKTLVRAVTALAPSLRHRLVREGRGTDVLLTAAMHSPVLERTREQSPLLPALLRGVQQRRQLSSAEGGMLSADLFAKALGVSRQAVDKQRRRGQLLAVRAGNVWRYPAWQIADGAVLPGLRRVLALLPGQSAWTVIAFCLSRNMRLGGRRPLDLLRRGDLHPVLSAARAFGEHGAA